jgi:exoribonuclease R
MIKKDLNTYDINNQFDTVYERTIYQKYRKNKLDEKHDDVKKNIYAIRDRLDFTNETTYTIDPEGCIDADDGFSILKEYRNNKLFLAIHIADPTHYIIPNSKYFQKISERIVTHYPSKNENNHMLDEEVMNLSSLIETEKYGNIKNAISLITEIDVRKKTLKKKTAKLEFTTIKVKNENKLNYDKVNLDLYPDIKLSLEISKNLKKDRIKSSKNVSDSECDIKYHLWGFTELKLQTKLERYMHIMIGEFALYMNTFVGVATNYYLGNNGIYRECSDKGKLQSLSSLSGNELRDFVIKYGIVAKYTSESKPHDIIGVKHYTHFTSPIRRFSDCLSHYLIKYIYIKNRGVDIGLPFTKDKLNLMIKNIDFNNSYQRNISFDDSKFRTIQALANMLVFSNSIEIEVEFLNYKKDYVNLKINNVNYCEVNYPIYFSCCYRRIRWDINVKNNWECTPIKKVKIYKINVPEKFFEGTFPDLDALF